MSDLNPLPPDIKEIVESLTAKCRDIDGSELSDTDQPIGVSCGDLRQAASALLSLAGERDYAWSEMKEAQAYMRVETNLAEQAEARAAQAIAERDEARRERDMWKQRAEDARYLGDNHHNAIAWLPPTVVESSGRRVRRGRSKGLAPIFAPSPSPSAKTARSTSRKPSPMKCKTCGSQYPHLHPAVQFEGEVETCPDKFHLRKTPQNSPAYIAAVEAKRTAVFEKAQPDVD